ncbi:thioredoxin family protein [Rubellicoccus peritrichatus]|uniref:Thioredoxin family protein n=1 Tax=Rubellicoccus peritrichatus TaxID=3080537 RepID=A0AAQ3QW55_9BACT|nr:thioredoxin family protein [Puniceicoccus sp. CR14]WOO42303.1 thioredoxin family protein [Puniceicoccus sp. CR14]
MLLVTPEAKMGWRGPDFALPDPDGKLFSLDQLKGEKGTLIAFICNHCPYVQAVIDRLVADANALRAEGVNTVAISSNDYRYVPADSPPMMKQFAKQHNFSFPYLVDEDQSVAINYGAVCTPDFFGFNAAGELQYRGRLDDARMGEATKRNPELLNAMLQIAKTEKGPAKQLPSMGCSIKWR